MALDSIFPFGLRGRVVYYRFIHWLVIAGTWVCGICSLAMTVSIWRLAHSARIDAPLLVAEWSALTWPLSISLGGFFLGSLVFGCVAAFRRYEIWFLEFRGDKARRLLGKTCRMASTAEPTDTAQKSAQQDHIRWLLQRVADALTISPYYHILRWLPGGRRLLPTASVWLLVPETKEGRLRGFRAAAYALANVPEAMRPVFKRLANEYRPAIYDEPRFQEMIEAAKAEGKNKKETQDIFRALCSHAAGSSKGPVCSLTGYVFHTGLSVLAADTRDCWAFQRNVIKAVLAELGTNTFDAWFDRQSVTACPIFGISGKNVRSPMGVLLVFKGAEWLGFTPKDRFTPEDLNSVMAASDLLGVCLSPLDDAPINFETAR